MSTESYLRLMITADGSNTIEDQDGNTYHSRWGAFTESMHVFIDAGLKKAVEEHGKEISVLETGFGTGLNALLTFQYAREQGLKIDYTGLELFPLEQALALSTDYPNYTGYPKDEEIFSLMHSSVTGVSHSITSYFQFRKLHEDIAMHAEKEKYHVIYFDAFAPLAQPELWMESVFRNMLNSLVPGGFLVTYCSKTIIRKAMMSAGFHVEKIPGPKGKREMVRAVNRV